VKGKDYFPDALIRPLVEASAERDRKCAQAVGIEVPTETLRTVGRYNAQDYLFQRLYPVPEHQTVRAILDFGAGLGRTANLAFGAPGNTTEFMVTVDGIPSTYLTQRLYFQGLGLRFADYLDGAAEGRRFDVGELRRRCQLVHLPTWRMDLVPDASMDRKRQLVGALRGLGRFWIGSAFVEDGGGPWRWKSTPTRRVGARSTAGSR
jgi:hypothetical protein